MTIKNFKCKIKWGRIVSNSILHHIMKQDKLKFICKDVDFNDFNEKTKRAIEQLENTSVKNLKMYKSTKDMFRDLGIKTTSRSNRHFLVYKNL